MKTMQRNRARWQPTEDVTTLPRLKMLQAYSLAIPSGTVSVPAIPSYCEPAPDDTILVPLHLWGGCYHLKPCCIHGGCYHAALAGHLECLQKLRSKGSWWDEQTCMAAAQGGHLACLQWARMNGCSWSIRTTEAAAATGNLACLRWARENGCPWNKLTCRAAAHGGHLACLQWARMNGCPWGRGTCAGAALCGHFDCLRWARENGAPWDERVTTWAHMAGGWNGSQVLAYYGQERCLHWAYENGCPWDPVKCPRLAVLEARRQRAAIIIQRAWLAAYHDPKRTTCRRRLLRQWEEDSLLLDSCLHT